MCRSTLLVLDLAALSLGLARVFVLLMGLVQESSNKECWVLGWMVNLALSAWLLKLIYGCVSLTCMLCGMLKKY